VDLIEGELQRARKKIKELEDSLAQTSTFEFLIERLRSMLPTLTSFQKREVLAEAAKLLVEKTKQVELLP
jgi:hypothetical protein